MNITLNIGDFLGDFEITREQMNKLRSVAAMALVEQAYILTTEQAAYRLHNSYLAYVDALSIEKENDYTYLLKLSGSKIAYMIESGASAFDMKTGFSKSSKIKYSKAGTWYLTIPMLFKTPNVSVHSTQPGQIMPRSIYDLIRNSPSRTFTRGNEQISILNQNKIPKKFDPVEKQIPVLDELKNKMETYVHKSSIYAGLQRTKDLTTGASKYNTFRRVSANSDKNSWIHPGINAYNIMDDAAKLVDEGKIMEDILRKTL